VGNYSSKDWLQLRGNNSSQLTNWNVSGGGSGTSLQVALERTREKKKSYRIRAVVCSSKTPRLKGYSRTAPESFSQTIKEEAGVENPKIMATYYWVGKKSR